MTDLFVHAPPLRVRLDRTADRVRPCCDNIAVVGPGKAQHAAELRCESCGAFRGWLPREALEFLITAAGRFGASPALPILRDHTIGDDMAKEFDNTNSGALFKNTDKARETDRDYSGTLNVNGTEFWMSGWVKVSKKGTKFLSLSIKPKDAAAAKSKASVGADLNDEIPFALAFVITSAVTWLAAGGSTLIV